MLRYMYIGCLVEVFVTLHMFSVFNQVRTELTRILIKDTFLTAQ